MLCTEGEQCAHHEDAINEPPADACSIWHLLILFRWLHGSVLSFVWVCISFQIATAVVAAAAVVVAATTVVVVFVVVVVVVFVFVVVVVFVVVR
mmetsp:Transcript_9146/g.15575  ORF Transcript_9146/g.15575 Transcript_9146/m.15575 type:complete len:94 (-) Transcript_9146:188-469(-)